MVAQKILGYYNARLALKNGEIPKVEDLWEVGVFNPFNYPDISDLFNFIHEDETQKKTRSKVTEEKVESLILPKFKKS